MAQELKVQSIPNTKSTPIKTDFYQTTHFELSTVFLIISEILNCWKMLSSAKLNEAAYIFCLYFFKRLSERVAAFRFLNSSDPHVHEHREGKVCYFSSVSSQVLPRKPGFTSKKPDFVWYCKLPQI